METSRPLIAEILCRVHGIISDGTSIVFMWVPSHVGQAGNLAVDIAAKATLLFPVSNLTVPNSVYNALIHAQALKQWHLLWNSITQNKLHAIEPRVNVINLFCLTRRNEIIIHILRIEYTYLTHRHALATRGDSPSVLGLSSRVVC